MHYCNMHMQYCICNNAYDIWLTNIVSTNPWRSIGTFDRKPSRSWLAEDTRAVRHAGALAGGAGADFFCSPASIPYDGVSSVLYAFFMYFAYFAYLMCFVLCVFHVLDGLSIVFGVSCIFRAYAFLCQFLFTYFCPRRTIDIYTNLWRSIESYEGKPSRAWLAENTRAVLRAGSLEGSAGAEPFFFHRHWSLRMDCLLQHVEHTFSTLFEGMACFTPGSGNSLFSHSRSWFSNGSTRLRKFLMCHSDQHFWLMFWFIFDRCFLSFFCFFDFSRLTFC